MSEAEIVWYIPGENNRPAGPFSTDQLLKWCRSGKLDGTILCWRKGMSDWQSLAEIQPFSDALTDISLKTDETETTTHRLESLSKGLGKAVNLTKKKAKIVRLKMSINKHKKHKYQILFELGQVLYEKESDSEILSKSPYVEKINQARTEDDGIHQLIREIETIKNSGQVNQQPENL